jgi:hypothetical protein
MEEEILQNGWYQMKPKNGISSMIRIEGFKRNVMRRGDIIYLYTKISFHEFSEHDTREHSISSIVEENPIERKDIIMRMSQRDAYSYAKKWATNFGFGILFNL